MSNNLMNNMLTEVVMEKAIRDKMGQQQKAQQEQERINALMNEKQDSEDDLDMDEDDLKYFAKMRDERLREVQSQVRQQTIKESKQYSVGDYREIQEDEFLPYTTRHEQIIVHFYHNEFLRCKIMDKHLQEIAHNHPETQIVSINAQKCAFFVTKLQIQTLPTLCFFKKGLLQGKLMGFEGLSGDEFKTIELSRKLVNLQMIKPKNNNEKGIKFSKNKKKDEDSDSGSDF